MYTTRGSVTVVVCDLEEAAGENSQVVVFEYHLDSDKAVDHAKKVVAEGWVVNNALPYEVAKIVADAYTYTVHLANVLSTDDVRNTRSTEPA